MLLINTYNSFRADTRLSVRPEIFSKALNYYCIVIMSAAADFFEHPHVADK